MKLWWLLKSHHLNQCAKHPHPDVSVGREGCVCEVIVLQRVYESYGASRGKMVRRWVGARFECAILKSFKDFFSDLLSSNEFRFVSIQVPHHSL